MKKVLFLFLTIFAFSTANLSAQSSACCTTSTTTDCKPKVCCPAKTNCCKSGSKTLSWRNVKAKVASIFKTETNEQKTEAIESKTAVAIKE